jgi:catechol 2,3-dioxygenase
MTQTQAAHTQAAQTQATKPGSPLLSHQGPLHIASVSLRARNMDQLATYYERVIGLQRIASGPDRITLGSGGIGYLHLLAAVDALPEPPRSAGLFHTAFLLPSRAELGVWFKAARLRNVRFDGASDHGVSDAFYLTDPEGNGIEVYADRPMAAWSRPAGGRPYEVEMTTLPMDVAAVVAAADALGTTAASGGFPAQARVGHVHLKVGDIAAAEAFYHDVLGLDRTTGRAGAAFFGAGGYHHHIATNTWGSAGATKRQATWAGLAAIEFAVDANHKAASLGSAIDDPWGNRLTFSTAPLAS